MLFNSFAFAILLTICFLTYWIFPYKRRWMVLLFVSYYFYMSWNVKYIGLIFLLTVISYFSAIRIEESKNEKQKKMYLYISLLISLGVLFFFKYFNFFSNSIHSVFQKVAVPLQPLTIHVLLPVGISFYTFQTLSYVIDVYKRKISAERHLGYYAVFVSFFPQLVAGPIERTDNFLPQVKKEQHFEYEKAAYGLKLMAWGYFKKLLIADVFASHVDKVYASLGQYRGFSLLLATLLFSIQIYCDFSGYSDIAIGTAKLFSIDLMINFKSPYFSASIKEFWSRWHISLSTWFRDYVYIPLGGNRCSKRKNQINLFITFLVSGLWHGADWSFVVWGGGTRSRPGVRKFGYKGQT